MIKNIIFDIDGTLWNSTEVVAKGWRRAVKETGYSKCEITGSILKKEFGLPMNIIADHVFSDLNDEDKKAELLKLCCKYEHELLEENTEDISYPGIVAEIKSLAKKYRVFIVSNCQRGYIELVCGKLGIEDCIEDYLCFGDTGLTKGETMKKLMERNGLSEKETVYVGDTAGDKAATEFAGAIFVYAAYGFGELEGERFFVKTPKDLTKTIEKIGRK
ncbi:MAG: HAD family hydrolase [Lachnospiraceae bacterium]|nr:HAD family hydrolase [Lachnospiraceae bacterium]